MTPAQALPASLRSHPRLGDWIEFDAPARQVRIRTGKVEIGQGILTALAQIAADELDVSVGRIVMVPADTRGPDEGVTSGSLSVQESGSAIRQACAEVRAAVLRMAAQAWDCEPSTLDVEDGQILRRGGTAATSYWALDTAGLLEAPATGAAAAKPSRQLRVVGKPVPRVDLPDKVFGRARFIHDLSLPGMCHGRVLRLPSPGARLASIDLSAARALPDVLAVVHDGSFVAAIARSEAAAERACARLAQDAAWAQEETLPDAQALPAFLRTSPATSSVVLSRRDAGAAAPVRTHAAEYLRPYLAHASIGLSCAVARWEGGRLEVWTHSQAIFHLRRDLVLALAHEPDAPALEDVHIHHVEGAGCYGHNPADDAAFDAVLLARALPGVPVRVQWSRADELSCGPLAPAHLVALSAGLDERGRIVSWRHEHWSNGYSSRPGRSAVPVLLAAGHRAHAAPPQPAINMPAAMGGGSERNAVPGYRIPDMEVTSHLVQHMPLRTSAIRALGAYPNVFAIESFMDELAALAGRDPVDFRLMHLDDERGAAVIRAAIAGAPWWHEAPAARGEGIGHGMGYARYKGTGAWCCVLARVEAGAEVRALDLAIAVDVGRVVNPDGVRNQIEGGAVQSASWTLREAVAFDRLRVLTRSWEDYPILRFDQAPRVSVTLLDQPDEDSLGAGEAAQGPVAAALANAVHDALGVRVRRLPLTADQIIAAADSP